MIKKISIFIIMLLLTFSTNAFAGDIPESIMHGDHQALFIGEITDINTDTITIIPSTIMMGDINHSEVTVKKFDGYYGTSAIPKAGDLIVAVLLDQNTIDDTWIFKCTLENYKTLKLISEQYDIVTRYETYINEGKYFESQKKIDKDKNISTTTNISVQASVSNQDSPEISSTIISISIFFIIMVSSIVIKIYKKRKLKK